MGDISNKALVLLLIVAIVVSFAGTLVSLNRLYKNIYPLTAFVTVPNATATLEITTGASLSFSSPTTVNWGTGYVNVSGTNPKNCTIDTMGGISRGCSRGASGFNAVSNGFTIQNDGNSNLTINLSINRTLAQFIGIAKGNFTFNASLNETGSCEDSNGNTQYPMGAESWFRTNRSWRPIDANISDGVIICTRLRYEDASDEINIDLNVSIPENAPTGIKTVGVIIKGTTI